MYQQVNVARSPESYDAIVVGSGISGGWAAKELCEKGLKTLVLERGRMVEHPRDYITEHKAPWEFAGRGALTQEQRQQYPYVSRVAYMAEEALHFFFPDHRSPYIEEKPFTWVRGNQVGGRSLMWGRQCYRWSDLDFEANAREGLAIDWPIRYADIAPWYDYVEGYVGITGEKLGLPHLPDGPFLPPMEMNVLEKHARERIQAQFPERVVTIGRAAILTQDHNGRQACHYCGPCWRGCSTASYFSSNSVTLPAAAKTGNLTIRPDSIVHSVVYDEQTDKATGVRVIDANTKEITEYTARVVFLCASAIGSTQVLLNSKTPRFPNGLANSSGVLGHYLMDHHFMVGAVGESDEFADRYYQGNRPNGIYIVRFRNISPETKMPEFVRGYGFQGGAERESWGRGNEVDGFGPSLKQTLRDPGPWQFSILAFGESLPYYENALSLDTEQVDEWGMPLLRFNAAWRDNEFAMRKDMQATAAEMLEAAGLKNILTYDAYVEGSVGAEPGLGIHEMGTARMGKDPKTSVLNQWNQCHDVSNVFVTDGAAMTSASCVNPSITYMALTARAVDYAVKEMQAGNI
jgi:choline dehydrogenase-like flavoprotein